MADIKFRPEDGKQYVEVPVPKFRIDDKVMFVWVGTFNKEFYVCWAKDLPNEKMIKNQVSIGTVVWAYFNPAGWLKWKYMIKHSVTSPEAVVFEEDVLPYYDEQPTKKTSKTAE